MFDVSDDAANGYSLARLIKISGTNLVQQTDRSRQMPHCPSYCLTMRLEAARPLPPIGCHVWDLMLKSLLLRDYRHTSCVGKDLIALIENWLSNARQFLITGCHLNLHPNMVTAAGAI